MTEIMKLADDYAQHKYVNGAEGRGPDAPEARTGYARAALQSAIEALQSKLGDAIQSSAHWQHQFTEAQAENERLKSIPMKYKRMEFNAQLQEENAVLQAKLDELSKQKPVGVVALYPDVVDWTGEEPPIGANLYAAPKALAPEKVEAAWRAGWAACRDAEYVGQEAENEAWGMSQTCANADWENAAPKALAPLTDERKYKLLDHGDEIQRGDTVLDDDATTWHPLAGWEVGMKWGRHLMPMRRAIEAAHGIGCTP